MVPVVAAILCAVTMPVLAKPASLAGSSTRAAACAVEWPLWQAFRDKYISADGRVIDSSVQQMHSTSEGQSYAMFFALVANDRASFDRLWRWSIDNLMRGDVASGLPAWQWGKQADGSWGVIDANAASDADLWFAYALLEAHRLWQHAPYRDDAFKLLAHIKDDEVVALPGFGAMLLPGPASFALENNTWRLNPSYLTLPLLRRLADADRNGPWDAIAGNTVRMLEAITPHGLAADWVAYQQLAAYGGQFVIDPVKGDLGSYDAIRTYLWAGMTSPEDPLATRQMTALRGLLQHVGPDGAVPEKLATTTGQVEGTGPIGFTAALLPYLTQGGREPTVQAARARVIERFQANRDKTGDPPYYDYVLSLFGLGWTDGLYRFLGNGNVHTSWEKACPYAKTP